MLVNFQFLIENKDKVLETTDELISVKVSNKEEYLEAMSIAKNNSNIIVSRYKEYLDDFPLKECILGFDPGGKGNFGWCIAENSDIFPLPIIKSGCDDNASNALNEIQRYLHGYKVMGAGIDAPLYWRADGAREADKIVRGLVPLGGKSTVLSVNSLQGACLAQGMMIASLLRRKYPDLDITEAHPKAYLKVTDTDDKDISSLCDLKWDNKRDENYHLRDAALACVAAWHMLNPANCENLYERDRGGEVFLPVNGVAYWFPKFAVKH
jgi:hypothetical protein